MDQNRPKQGPDTDGILGDDLAPAEVAVADHWRHLLDREIECDAQDVGGDDGDRPADPPPSLEENEEDLAAWKAQFPNDRRIDAIREMLKGGLVEVKDSSMTLDEAREMIRSSFVLQIKMDDADKEQELKSKKRKK